jgi:hypothetical protein
MIAAGKHSRAGRGRKIAISLIDLGFGEQAAQACANAWFRQLSPIFVCQPNSILMARPKTAVSANEGEKYNAFNCKGDNA